METKTLEKIGLSKNEIKVYLALLKEGSSSVSDISKKVNMHRVNIYDTLERLKRKGLIGSVIKMNKNYFEAAHPDKIKEMVDEKEEEIKEIKSLLPELNKYYNSYKKNHEIFSFKGILGVKTILNDVIKSRPIEILNLGSTKSMENFPSLVDIWNSERVRKKIPIKIITSKKIKPNLKRQKLQKIKFIDKPFDAFTSTLVYEGKVAILMWLEEPIAIRIDSAELAETYRNYFNSLWKNAED